MFVGYAEIVGGTKISVSSCDRYIQNTHINWKITCVFQVENEHIPIDSTDARFVLGVIGGAAEVETEIDGTDVGRIWVRIIGINDK